MRRAINSGRRNVSILVFVLVAIGFVLASSVVSSAQTTRGGAFVSGELIVKFRPGAAANETASAHRAAGATLLAQIPRTNVHRVRVPAGNEAAALERYQRNPNVLSVDFNYIRHLPALTSGQSAPADQSFPQQWALDNTGQSFYCIPWIGEDLCFYSGTPDADIDAPEAWAITRGSPAVTVAVIDSGVDYTHPDLAPNYAGGDDFTSPDGDPMDDHGHGTHVAGIIAGQCAAPLPGAPAAASLQFAGMAPLARLYGLKVLDDDGNGRDSWIIKGVQQVAELNERAGELVVHGVNLSLGGYFDAESYGCGFTPLCNELRRLWRQGVVVVIAAGNDGLAWLMQGDGEAYPLNLDLSIGDPANLEESLAVGSVHKSSPHSYGISYFSSRGPTADGRYKPDLVAPGEKILSAHHGFAIDEPDTWMVEMSGTSMAAAHVSGLLAGFLSARREFIGAPDRVKQLVLAQCLDLQRDRYMQGSGLPSLMRMLGGT